MVLTAIMDCLVASELETLISTLRRDGIRCLSSETPLETLHEEISTYATQPIVIYGKSSLNVPYDDCPRLWLCCGPDNASDEKHATWLLGGESAAADYGFAEHVERRQKAMRFGYKLISYVDALCFMANVLASQCVDSMKLGNKAAGIILRHVTKTDF